MEEDHYVAEDFLHVLWLQQQLLKGGIDCPFCNQARILSLGSYPKYFNHREASSMVIPKDCWPTRNIGINIHFFLCFEFFKKIPF